MSLLGSQVYANPDTPCWVSANGDTINGNLTVTGSISAGTSITAGPAGVIAPDVGNGFTVLNGVTVETRLQHIQAPAPRTLMSSDDPIYFTKPGQINGNTSLTIAAFGAPDVLNVEGVIQANVLRLDAGVCGTGSILVGQTNVVIPTTAVSAQSIILVSHSGAAAAGPGNGAAQGGLTVNPALIVPGVSFRVDLVDPTTGIAVAASLVNAEFNWLLVNQV